MSEIWVTNVYNQAGDGSPNFPNGATVAGVITATTFKGGADITSGTINATSATFSGAVSVGGTLTYEDVTNIDSVGIITARQGIKVIAGGVNAVGVVTATSFKGDGSSLTGMASTDKVSTATLNVSGISTFASQVSSITAMGANAVDCSTANYFTKTITGATTFTFTNVPTGVAYGMTMEVTLNGSNAITWPATVKWPADTAPSITDGKTQLFMFVTDDGGTRWRGSSLVDYTN